MAQHIESAVYAFGSDLTALNRDDVVGKQAGEADLTISVGVQTNPSAIAKLTWCGNDWKHIKVFNFADAPQCIRDSALFRSKLRTILNMLPLAAAAGAGVATRRFTSIGTGRGDLDQFADGVVLSQLREPNGYAITRRGACDHDDAASIPPNAIRAVRKRNNV
jgi:hypothetical protein